MSEEDRLLMIEKRFGGNAKVFILTINRIIQILYLF